MRPTPSGSRPATSTLLAAFLVIYLVWGSTYLAIRFAVETIPPYLALGLRFAVAGAMLFAWLVARGRPWPSRAHWFHASVTGGLMLFVGTGSVAVAEQHIPSGVAALLIGTTPLWMVLLAWLWKGGPRPHGSVFLGLAIGFVGVAVLFDAPAVVRTHGLGALPGLMVVGASLAWSVATVHSRDADLPDDPLQTSAMQMLCGGLMLLAGSGLSGEWSGFEVGAVSLRSGLSVVYLLVFGSFLAFSAYVWLIKHTTASRLSTYAFVNPAVAVLLGSWLANEPFTPRIAAAMLMLVASVILIVRYGSDQH